MFEVSTKVAGVGGYGQGETACPLQKALRRMRTEYHSSISSYQLVFVQGAISGV